jgi:hypothetical protein
VIASGLPEDERRLRAGLVASQLLGLAMTRYVWRVGALADLSPEAVSKVIFAGDPALPHRATP